MTIIHDRVDSNKSLKYLPITKFDMLYSLSYCDNPKVFIRAVKKKTTLVYSYLNFTTYNKCISYFLDLP